MNCPTLRRNSLPPPPTSMTTKESCFDLANPSSTANSLYGPWEIELFDQKTTLQWQDLKENNSKQGGPSFYYPGTVVVTTTPGTKQQYNFNKILSAGTYGKVLLYKNEAKTRAFVIKVSLVDESRVITAAAKGCAHHVKMRELHFSDRLDYPTNIYPMTEINWYIMPVLDTAEKMRFYNRTPGIEEAVDRICEAVRVQLVCLLEQTKVPYLDMKLDNVLIRQVGSTLCVHLGDIGSLVTKRLEFERENWKGRKIQQRLLSCSFPPPEWADTCIGVFLARHFILQYTLVFTIGNTQLLLKNLGFTSMFCGVRPQKSTDKQVVFDPSAAAKCLLYTPPPPPLFSWSVSTFILVL